MKTQLLGLLAESPIHVGSGRSLGVVDLPIAREATTSFPTVPGSGLKGALKDQARANGVAELKAIFGEADRAGLLRVGDARLLLLPVRSMSGSYRWCTCPIILERFKRDCIRSGLTVDWKVPSANSNTYRGQDQGALLLEELEFAHAGAVGKPVIEALGSLLAHEDTKKRLESYLVLVSDEDFSVLCRSAVPVAARNVLEENTKRSTNLWYEESLPPDTVFSCLLSWPGEANGISDSPFASLWGEATPPAFLQLGGNETVGMGWVAVTPVTGGQQP